MLLKEFALTAPEFEREKRFQFELRTRSTCALYEKCLQDKLKTNGIWKVLVRCVKQPRNTELKNLLGVATIERPFDFGQFELVDSRKKSEMVLDAIHAGALHVAHALSWEKDSFEAARTCVVARDFRNEWVWKPPKTSPDKHLKGEVYCVHGVDSFEGYLCILDRAGRVVVRKQVINELPDELIFSPYLGRAYWVDKQRFKLESKDKEESWSVEVENNQWQQ